MLLTLIRSVTVLLHQFNHFSFHDYNPLNPGSPIEFVCLAVIESEDFFDRDDKNRHVFGCGFGGFIATGVFSFDPVGKIPPAFACDVGNLSSDFDISHVVVLFEDAQRYVGVMLDVVVFDAVE